MAAHMVVRGHATGQVEATPSVESDARRQRIPYEVEEDSGGRKPYGRPPDGCAEK